jgi:hypothetical protein
MMLALAEGKLRPSDLKREGANYLAAYNRANRGRWTERTLDAPLYDDGGTTLGDRITSDTFHF